MPRKTGDELAARETRRPRQLLLHKKQIDKMLGAVKRDGGDFAGAIESRQQQLKLRRRQPGERQAPPRIAQDFGVGYTLRE